MHKKQTDEKISSLFEESLPYCMRALEKNETIRMSHTKCERVPQDELR